MAEILSDDDLFSLAENVWSSMLSLELVRAAETEGKIGEAAITSCVQITGEWEGAVLIACSHRMATKFAAAMFQMEVDELSDDEVRDAMGEIANMTGGSVKGLAPGANALALPTVTEGDEHSFGITKTTQLNRVVVTSDGEPVIITVLGRQS